MITQPTQETGDPLTPEQLKEFNAALKEAAAVINTARDRERQAPRLNFIAAAEDAGFTAKQAEFLWGLRHRPEPRF